MLVNLIKKKYSKFFLLLRRPRCMLLYERSNWQLLASFVVHFKENHQNTIYVYFEMVIEMVIRMLHGKMNITW